MTLKPNVLTYGVALLSLLLLSACVVIEIQPTPTAPPSPSSQTPTLVATQAQAATETPLPPSPTVTPAGRVLASPSPSFSPTSIPATPTAVPTSPAASIPTPTLQPSEFAFQVMLDGGKAVDETLTVTATFINRQIPGLVQPGGRVVLAAQPPYPQLIIQRPGYLRYEATEVSAADLAGPVVLLAGDVDDDGQINQRDIDLIVSLLGSEAADPTRERMDYNADGLISNADLALAIKNQ